MLHPSPEEATWRRNVGDRGVLSPDPPIGWVVEVVEGDSVCRVVGVFARRVDRGVSRWWGGRASMRVVVFACVVVSDDQVDLRCACAKPVR